MFKLILKFLQWLEAGLQKVEDARIADVVAAQAAIEAHKVAQAAAEAEQTTANKIRSVLAALRA